MSDPKQFERHAKDLADSLGSTPVLAAQRGPLLQKVSFLVLARSQPRTPVRTGTLRRSESTRVEADGSAAYVESRVIYARFVHDKVPFFELGAHDAATEINAALAAAGAAYVAELAKV